LKKLYDYIIVGSGAGGSTAFYELTKNRNRRILMIEEGIYSASDVRSQSLGFINRNLYRDSGIRPALGKPPITIGEGKAVGGSTEINGGLFWRTPDHILKLWRAKGISWADNKNLEPIFQEYETLLRVKFENTWPEYDIASRLLEAGAEKLGWKCVKVPRATGGNCIRSNVCPSGCPSGAKNSMSQTLIPKGIEYGGELRTGIRVLKLVAKEEFITVEAYDSSGEKIEFRATKIIVSCGAVETPRLLVRSGIIKARNIKVSFHANLKVFAHFPVEVNPNLGTIFTRQVQQFLADGILIMGANAMPGYMAIASGSFNSETYNYIKANYSQFALYTAQTQVVSQISLLRWPLTNFLLRISWNDTDLDKIRFALMKTIELVFNAGAKRVLLPFLDASPISSQQEAMDHVSIEKLKSLQVSTVHLMSSLPLSTDPESALDDLARIRCEPRIQVLDASALPSSTIESPQETIMAMVAHVIRASS
jgi:choline dehydrogenase-like flavoprotein